MNRYKKFLCTLLTIFLAANLSACSLDAFPAGDSLSERIEKYFLIEIMGSNPVYVEYQYNPSVFVAFFKEEDADGVYIPISEINVYETQYPDCSGTWYRDQLSGEELTIYNAYLYAMEHCYKGFSLFVEDNEKDFWYIRDMVALDSPFLEQNYDEEGEFTRSWDPSEDGQRIYFHADQFGQEYWSQKLTALDQCKKIIAEMPAELESQEEKMLYLYHYVCDQITYTEYDRSLHPNYLYDGVCLGKTNCDGYSNMLSLLFNLLGTDACEITGYDEEPTEDAQEDNDGHTWVAAKLGEHYYHFDATYEDTTEDVHTDRMIYFGISDTMASCDIIDYDTLTPVCSDSSRDLSFVDLTMANITDHEQINTLAELTDQQAKKYEFETYVLVNCTVSDEELDAMLDRYVEMVYEIESVSVYYIEIHGRTLMRVATKPW